MMRSIFFLLCLFVRKLHKRKSPIQKAGLNKNNNILDSRKNILNHYLNLLLTTSSLLPGV